MTPTPGEPGSGAPLCAGSCPRVRVLEVSRYVSVRLVDTRRLSASVCVALRHPGRLTLSPVARSERVARYDAPVARCRGPRWALQRGNLCFRCIVSTGQAGRCFGILDSDRLDMARHGTIGRWILARYIAPFRSISQHPGCVGGAGPSRRAVSECIEMCRSCDTRADGLLPPVPEYTPLRAPLGLPGVPLTTAYRPGRCICGPACW